MGIATGLAAFMGGALVGGYLVADYFGSLNRVRNQERKSAERREAELKQRLAQLDFQVQMRESALARAEQRRVCESSWCDGFEAGLREGMSRQTIGDVVSFTRIHNARRIQTVNE